MQVGEIAVLPAGEELDGMGQCHSGMAHWDSFPSSPPRGRELAKGQVPLSQVVLNFLWPPEGAGFLQGLGPQP